jgi:LL-diaminopimelate aminotransferase
MNSPVSYATTCDLTFFDKVYEKLKQAKADGKKIYNLSVGDPDLAPPTMIKELLVKGLNEQDTFSYPALYGESYFLNSVQEWFAEKFNTSVEPGTELIPLLGVKEGISHLALGLLRYGDSAAYVVPGYPIYKQAIRMAGASQVELIARAENNYIPDIEQLPESQLRKIRLLYLNYPHNPTGAVLTKGAAENLIEFAKKYKFFICLVCVYARITPNRDYDHFSILSIPGAKECCVEMYSFSKDYCLPGIRLGFAVGNPTLIRALKRVKTQVDVSAFKPIQYAGSYLLRADTEGQLQSYFDSNNEHYLKRLQSIYQVLNKHRISYYPAKGTFYIWFQTPNLANASTFSELLFQQEGLLVVPGQEFGEHLVNWCRMTVSKPDDVIAECTRRLDMFLHRIGGQNYVY